MYVQSTEYIDLSLGQHNLPGIKWIGIYKHVYKHVYKLLNGNLTAVEYKKH